jgi:hypothetical protein
MVSKSTSPGEVSDGDSVAWRRLAAFARGAEVMRQRLRLYAAIALPFAVVGALLGGWDLAGPPACRRAIERRVGVALPDPLGQCEWARARDVDGRKRQLVFRVEAPHSSYIALRDALHLCEANTERGASLFAYPHVRLHEPWWDPPELQIEDDDRSGGLVAGQRVVLVYHGAYLYGVVDQSPDIESTFHKRDGCFRD